MISTSQKEFSRVSDIFKYLDIPLSFYYKVRKEFIEEQKTKKINLDELKKLKDRTINKNGKKLSNEALDLLIKEINKLYYDKETLSCRKYIELLRSKYGVYSSRRRVYSRIKDLGLKFLKSNHHKKRGRKKKTKVENREQNLISKLKIERPYQVLSSDFLGLGYRDKRTNKFVKVANVVFILDLYTREILAHKVSKMALTDSLIEVINITVDIVKNHSPVIFHSDNGSQFTSKEFMDLLSRVGISQSFSAPGTPTENAYAERFVKTLKELVKLKGEIRSFDDTVKRVNKVIFYYNNERRHSSIQNKTPVEFRKEYFRKL